MEYRLSKKAEVTIWDEYIVSLGETTLDILIGAVEKFDFAIFIFSNDDIINSRGRVFQGPRDNVIFELGLFMSKLGKNRVYIINAKKQLKIPSDLEGITFGIIDQDRDDNNLIAAVSPVCTILENQIDKLGKRKENIIKSIIDQSLLVNEHIPKSLQNHFSKIGIDRIDYSFKTGFSIKESIDTVQLSLSFLGIAGIKWVNEREVFSNMIKRLVLRKTNNQIRFLLLNPDSDSAISFNKARNFPIEVFKEEVNNTIHFLIDIREKSGIDIQIKLYDELPNWRMTIIDGFKIALGNYSPMSKDGYNSPQLIFKSGGNWNFSHNLISYYEEKWNTSKII
ncbi:nucleotide-binding protein [Polaribacter sp. Hel1_85]|nr:nucleotide-binding protein [Polaribacter sp. Hel1_85]